MSLSNDGMDSTIKNEQKRRQNLQDFFFIILQLPKKIKLTIVVLFFHFHWRRVDLKENKRIISSEPSKNRQLDMKKTRIFSPANYHELNVIVDIISGTHMIIFHLYVIIWL